MQVSQSGANIGSNNDLILIFGVLAVAGVILWKTGIFGTAKAVTDVADTVVKAAGTVVTDVANLPQNVVTLIGDIGQLPQAYYSITHPITTESIFNDAIKNKGKAMDGLTARTMTMIYSIYKRYVGVNNANWSAMAVANGATFDSVGNISSDKTLSLGESQVYPIAKD